MITPLEKSNPASPLDKCADKFTQWRATRENRRTPVPASLRQQALDLLNDYRKSHVIKALGINNTMLKNWQGKETDSPPATPFIPLKTETTETASPLALTLSDSQLHVTGNFSLAQLTAFAQGLCPTPGQESSQK